jgi:hypothetical protein
MPVPKGLENDRCCLGQNEISFGVSARTWPNPTLRLAKDLIANDGAMLSFMVRTAGFLPCRGCLRILIEDGEKNV